MLRYAHGQATAGSDGRILLFDSSLFAAGAGGILSPAAAQQITSTGSPIMGLEWLSGETSMLGMPGAAYHERCLFPALIWLVH